ncbi:hypothetical protein FKW77_002489 [Venturia effusa]|uniref:Homeobox domain-containing protein n=1 Tax=Venturia effusa TaxID=50376 RepID=A0A517LPQ2_9PEZI|nr:hypothetical protein FKW77_002489 [Venturia effusa]
MPISEDSAGTSQCRKKRRHQISLASLNILQDWLSTHLVHPYPNTTEKFTLSIQTGLTVKQVSTWFTNNRSRQLDPLQQWLSCSSEDEAVSPMAINRAAQDLDFDITHLNKQQQDHPASSAGSPASVNSAFSQCEDARWSGPRRSGRRKTYALSASPGSFTRPGASSPDLEGFFIESEAKPSHIDDAVIENIANWNHSKLGHIYAGWDKAFGDSGPIEGIQSTSLDTQSDLNHDTSLGEIDFFSPSYLPDDAPASAGIEAESSLSCRYVDFHTRAESYLNSK